MQTLILAILLSFLVSLGLGHIAIPLLHRLKFGQPIREDGRALLRAATVRMR